MPAPPPPLPPIARLPDDVQYHIFKNLNAKNLRNLKQSSKELHRIFKGLARTKATAHGALHQDKGKHLRDLVLEVLRETRAATSFKRKVLKVRFFSATIDPVGSYFRIRTSNLMVQTSWEYHPFTNTARLSSEFGVNGQLVGVALALRNAGVKVVPADKRAQSMLISLGFAKRRV